MVKKKHVNAFLTNFWIYSSVKTAISEIKTSLLEELWSFIDGNHIQLIHDRELY